MSGPNQRPRQLATPKGVANWRAGLNFGQVASSPFSARHWRGYWNERVAAHISGKWRGGGELNSTSPLTSPPVIFRRLSK